MEPEGVPLDAPHGSKKFAVLSTLYMRVDDITDLPSGTHVCKDQEGFWREFETSKIPTLRLQAAIAEGRVFAHLSAHHQHFDELDANWPSRLRLVHERPVADGNIHRMI